jgi:hypothetical protein
VTDLEGAAIWSNNTLPPLCETLLIPNKISYLDDVASNAIIQDLNSLSDCNASRKEFNHISCLEYDIGIICFPRCTNRHRAVNKIERACYVLPGKDIRSELPRNESGQT